MSTIPVHEKKSIAPPRLEDISIEYLACHTDAIHSLQGMPEELSLKLFQVETKFHRNEWLLFFFFIFTSLASHFFLSFYDVQKVIERGKLTPRLLLIFEKAEHDAVALRIEQLGISAWTPPLVIDSEGGWLGQRHHLW